MIKFAAAAAEAMRADGCNVLMEGRAQTLDYVRAAYTVYFCCFCSRLTHTNVLHPPVIVLLQPLHSPLLQVRTPHRFELVLSEPLVIGMRRAAQRMVGGALIE